MIIQKSHGRTVPVERNNSQKFKMVAKTMHGLEEILAEELRECGAEQIEPLTRAVSFEGDMRVLYRANYTCRTALAILKPFAEFEADDDQQLYDNVYRIKWEKILDVDGTFMIDSTTSGEYFTHSYYAALKTKDAIVDRFRRMFNRRPSIDTENADFKLNLHIVDNHVTLLLNSSGESLHKRGYRQAVGVAPINEVLAAGMIKLSGWKCDCNFYDPMCGSGTLLIEAAMMANCIPAQYYRHENSTSANGRASRNRKTAKSVRWISTTRFGATISTSRYSNRPKRTSNTPNSTRMSCSTTAASKTRNRPRAAPSSSPTRLMANVSKSTTSTSFTRVWATPSNGSMANVARCGSSRPTSRQ